MFRRNGAAALLTAVAALGCGRPADPDPRMISEWAHTWYGLVRAERLTPPVASRLLAYATVALHEGLAAGLPRLPTAVGALQGLDSLPQAAAGRHDPTLIAVAAEAVVLDSLFAEGLPTTRATVAGLVDSLRQVQAAAGVGAETAARSEDLGRRIGLAVVAWSRRDGFDSTRTMAYTPPVGPGLWVNDSPASIYSAQNVSGVTQSITLDNPNNQFRAGRANDRDLILNRPKPAGLGTLPNFDVTGATEPYWGSIRPFVLAHWDECPIDPPPPYTTEPGTALYREAAEVRDAKTNLTPEQRTIALYWADNPGETGTPAGHWMSIAAQMISQQGLGAADAARLMLVAAAAQADAFIAGWGYKYHFSLIRPRTYIRRIIEPGWEPLVPTPTFPEYPSGHSTQSAAAAGAITAFLGPVAFDDSTSLAIGHDVRRFASFAAAAEEAGMSRIYGGIHYHAGKNAGKQVGACIGRLVAERLGVTPRQ
ncbi:MAG: vanadium-dependent haloperoxidase [Gemmatimonadales bacterium]